MQKQSVDLFDYLQFVQNYAYEENKIDKKRLHDYFIENDAFVVSIEYWKGFDINGIPKEKKWDINDFLKPLVFTAGDNQQQQQNRWHIVIGAEFGVGKSSYSKYIASKLADNYLYNKNEYPDYIPVLVNLKNSEQVYNHYNLDDTLGIISKGDKSKKILCIYDGFDEYEKGKPEDFFKEWIHDKKIGNGYQEIKFIVTTRLESDKYPSFLQINNRYKDTFVRLFPFQNDDDNTIDGKKQTDSFFVKYGISLEFDILKNFIEPDVLSKPLFCWMVAYTFQRDKVLLQQLGISSNDSGTTITNSQQEKLNSAIIYLSCFHSIIKGKHKEDLEQDYKFDFNTQHIREKSILRKIAALKEIYGDSLTYEKAYEKIKKFENESDSKLLTDFDKVFGDIVSSYFYYPSKERRESRIDFMHKSFKDFFLAEYYIESIVSNNPHRLNLGISSGFDVVLQFLNDLLKIIVTKAQSNSREEVYSIFIDSLKPKYNGHNNNNRYNNKSIADIIIEDSKDIAEKEIFVYRSNANNNNENTLEVKSTNEGIWAIKKLTKNDYYEMLQHRWISLYCLTNTFYYKDNLNKNEQQNEQKFIIFNNKNDISTFIRFSSHIVRGYDYLKCLIKSDLSFSDLSNADLPYADLSDANFYYANLSNANLSYAFLSNSDLSYATLSNADLTGADLSDANLYGTVLYTANLSNANLSYAKLSDASLIHTNLPRVDLSYANLSYANLYGAKLFNSNLSYANLSQADLSQSLLINIQNFESLTLDQDTKFDDSLTDMPEFREYVKKNYILKVLAKLVENKQQLIEELKLRDYSDNNITAIVNKSRFML